MDPDPIELTRQTYNRIAAQFANVNAVMPEQVAEMATRLIAQIQPDERILDLGCGPGRDLAWFVAHGTRVTGADLSAGMLVESWRIVNVGLCQMDFRRLGFANGSFSGVWCNAALLHLPKREVPAALAEIRRILSPGGCFFASVQQGYGESIEINPLNGAQRFFARYQAPEMIELLENAGFSVLNQEIQQDNTRPECGWIWHETVRKESN